MNLAQASEIAGGLSAAQDVQQVLAWVVGALVVALVAVVVFHLKERAKWDRYQRRMLAKVIRCTYRTEKMVAFCSGKEPEEADLSDLEDEDDAV